MAVNAVGMAVVGLWFALARAEPGGWALAMALGLWALVELQIGLFRSYQGVVPRDRLVAAAPGLALGSLAGSVALLATTLVATVGRLVAEERLLAAELGEGWRAYAARTWRLLPFIY